MYMCPKKYKCPKCDFEIEFSVSEFKYPFQTKDYEYLCIYCVMEYLKQYVPILVEIKE